MVFYFFLQNLIAAIFPSVPLFPKPPGIKIPEEFFQFFLNFTFFKNSDSILKDLLSNYYVYHHELELHLKIYKHLLAQHIFQLLRYLLYFLNLKPNLLFFSMAQDLTFFFDLILKIF